MGVSGKGERERDEEHGESQIQTANKINQCRSMWPTIRWTLKYAQKGDERRRLRTIQWALQFVTTLLKLRWDIGGGL